MKYGTHAGSGVSGIEMRKSAMITYSNSSFSMSLGTNIWSGMHAQRTGIVSFQKGDFSFSYENDGAPFGNKLGDWLNPLLMPSFSMALLRECFPIS